MAKVKASELDGIALDWAVAKCEGWEGVICKNPTWSVPLYIATNDTGLHTFSPSTDWSQGGPIIGQHQILFHGEHGAYQAWIPGVATRGFTSETHLIAAMRCLVEARLGDEVEIPEELL